jgi:hypothetical protein
MSIPLLSCVSPLWKAARLQLLLSENESENCVTTDGHLSSLSWCQAPISSWRPDCCYCQTVAGLLMWGALSDERKGLSFTIAAGPAIAVIPGADSYGIHDHILLSQIRDSPNLEGQVSVFISPSNRVFQLYPQRRVPFSSPPTTRRSTVEVFLLLSGHFVQPVSLRHGPR